MSYLDRINIDFDRDLFILPVDEYKRDIVKKVSIQL